MRRRSTIYELLSTVFVQDIHELDSREYHNCFNLNFESYIRYKNILVCGVWKMPDSGVYDLLCTRNTLS